LEWADRDERDHKAASDGIGPDGIGPDGMGPPEAE
jgi:hypothetical protein